MGEVCQSRSQKRPRKIHNYKNLNEGVSEESQTPLLIKYMEHEDHLHLCKNIANNSTNNDDKELMPGPPSTDQSRKLKLKFNCLICNSSFKHDSAFSARNNFTSSYCSQVFTTFCRLLQIQHNPEFSDEPSSSKLPSFTWEANEFPLPFCTQCAKDVIGLMKLQSLIEGYQKSIAEVVRDIKLQIHQTELHLQQQQEDVVEEQQNKNYETIITTLRKSVLKDFESTETNNQVKEQKSQTTPPGKLKKQRRRLSELLEPGCVKNRFNQSQSHEESTLVNDELIEAAISQQHVLDEDQMTTMDSNLEDPLVICVKIEPEHEFLPAYSLADKNENERSANDDSLDLNEDLGSGLDEQIIHQGQGVDKRVTQQQTEEGRVDDTVFKEEEPIQKRSKNINKPVRGRQKKKKMLKSTRKPKVPLTITKDGKTTFKGIEVQSVQVGNATKYHCTLCGSTKKELAAIKYHIKLAHKDGVIKEYKCEYCFKVLINIESLSRHKDIYHSNKPRPLYSCDLCGLEFKGQRSLTCHKGLVHSIGLEALYSCDICSRPFAQEKRVTIHRATHMNEEERMALLLESPQASSSSNPVIQNQEKEENKACNDIKNKNIIMYQCSYCNKSLASDASLQHHEKTHTGEQPYVCEHCGSRFRYKGNLTAHTQLHKAESEREFRFKCDFPDCLKAYPRKSQLVNHSYSHRPQIEKPYKCSTCGQCFVRPFDLSLHHRKHTGEKPYVCSICSASFARSSGVRRHLKQVHKLKIEDLPPSNQLIETQFQIVQVHLADL